MRDVHSTPPEYPRPTRRLWSLLMLRRSSLRVARWNMQPSIAIPFFGAVSHGFWMILALLYQRVQTWVLPPALSMLWGSCAPIAAPYLHIHCTKSPNRARKIHIPPVFLIISEVSILEHFTLGRNLPTLQGTLALLASGQVIASSFSEAVWKSRICIWHYISKKLEEETHFSYRW